MSELVAVLYVIGGLLTAGGVLRAYRRAVRDKARLDGIRDQISALAGPTPDEMAIAEFNAALSDDLSDPAVRALADAQAERDLTDEQLTSILQDLGVDDPLPTYADARLPVAYWARRSALADTLVQFRTDGLVALAGLAISTVASVWSLYL